MRIGTSTREERTASLPGVTKPRPSAPDSGRRHRKQIFAVQGMELQLPSSTLMDGRRTAKKRKLSEAAMDALGMTPQAAQAVLQNKTAATMADLIAVSIAVRASQGDVKAFEILGDRTEGKPGVQGGVEQTTLVERILDAFLAERNQKPVQALPVEPDYRDAEEVIVSDTRDPDDIPIGEL